MPWLPGILAITLWPFILYRKGFKTKCIQLHEHHHWHQALKWGVLPQGITATITDVILRALVSNIALTIGADEMNVYTFAVS